MTTERDDALTTQSPTSDAGLTDFRMIKRIGRGASATVYQAVHTTFEWTVALKRWQDTISESQRRKFLEECRLQWRLSDHPNIVRLYWAGLTSTGVPWSAMELFAESLAARLSRAPGPRLDEALRISFDLLEGVSAIHASGHLHRDIKPGNVLLKRGRAALADLGIAMRIDNITVDQAAGTVRYLAPELLRGSSPDYTTDVYSAALTIHDAMPDDTPAAIERVLVRASSFEPRDRPGDGAEFLSQLQDAAVANRRPGQGAQPTP